MRVTAFFLFTAISVFSACSKESDIHVPTQSGGQGGTITITPFTQLNAAQTEINSHEQEWEHSSLKMDWRSYIELGAENNVVNPTYSRIRTLKDGSYILTWQNAVGVNGNGQDTFYSLSKDLKTWTYMGYLWQSQSVTNGLGNPDTRRYTNANTLQLSNGELIAVAAFSTIKTYSLSPDKYRNEQGLVIKRSKDGGKTWFGEKEIYHGPCWEAHLIELPSGEIQCFFSESRPTISGSHSGTVMVYSKDGGTTWSPELGNDAYRVMRKLWWNAQKNLWCFTYQMPVGVILNNSKQFAFAMESCNQRVLNGTKYSDQFSVAICFSKEDGQWEYMSGTEITPKEQRIDSLVTRGAAPYLVQFPSGETLLAYGGTDALQHFRLGNARATEFGNDITALPDKGSWGGLDLTASHSVLSCMRDSKVSDNVTIALARFNLNHTINATRRTVAVDGNNSEWTDTDEALFIGSKCQAQATLRCSCDEKNYYFLVEVLDNTLSTSDFGYILLSPNDGTGKVSSKARRIRFGCQGLKSADIYAGGWKEYSFGASAVSSFEGTTTDKNDTDKGFITEICVPREAVSSQEGRILVDFGYFDASANVEDVIADANSTTRWIPVVVD